MKKKLGAFLLCAVAMVYLSRENVQNCRNR